MMGEPRGLRGELHLPGLGYLHPVHVLSQLARPVPLPMGVPPFALTHPMPHALKMMGGGMGAMYPWGLSLHSHMLGAMRPGGPQLGGSGHPSPDRHLQHPPDEGKGELLACVRVTCVYAPLMCEYLACMRHSCESILRVCVTHVNISRACYNCSRLSYI